MNSVQDFKAGIRLGGKRAVLSLAAALLIGLSASGPAADPVADVGRLELPKETIRVSLPHHLIAFKVGKTAFDAIFINGGPCVVTNGLCEAWIHLKPGPNMIVVTGLREKQTSILDSRMMFYDVSIGKDTGRDDPFGDADGDGVPNGIDVAPHDASKGLGTNPPGPEGGIEITYPLNGQIFGVPD